MKYRKHWVAFLPIAAWHGTSAVAEAQTAEEIVLAADKVRNPDKPFRSTLRLTEYVDGRERDRDSLILYSKEDAATRQFRNLVQYVEPASDTGSTSKAPAGRRMWLPGPRVTLVSRSAQARSAQIQSTQLSLGHPIAVGRQSLELEWIADSAAVHTCFFEQPRPEVYDL